jgi:hypothetical protein
MLQGVGTSTGKSASGIASSVDEKYDCGIEECIELELSFQLTSDEFED